MPVARPVVLIALDATEITLLDELCDAGKLPVLAGLRREGRSGILEARPQAFVSMVWPTFASARRVSHHGWYVHKVWNHERMQVEYATPERLPLRPFWEALDPSRFRAAILDVPFASPPPAGFPEFFLTGWQNHDDCGRGARPAGLWRDIQTRFGRPALRREIFGEQSPRTLLRMREEVLASIDQFAAIAGHVLSSMSFDLFVAAFGGAHRGTHYLWDLSQVDVDGMNPRDLALLSGARDEIYQACDLALGRLLERVPAEARLLVFALHGMGPNTGWWERFGEMLALLEAGRGGGPSRPGLLYRLKKALPWKLARQVTTRLPGWATRALVPLWSRRMRDWTSVRYFPLPCDLNGFIRINLKGRETPGVVTPGAEYDALSAELAEGLLTFRDIETGTPVVAGIDRIGEIVSPDSPCRDLLPDLTVRWSDRPMLGSTGVRSPVYGEARWEKGARLPSGRSGNHRGRGWFVARGEGIAPGRVATVHDVIDLAPTVFRWLGAEVPASFQGQPIGGI
jgi:predicted AlkP superfamily phosphohydrolase/phosphomutase